MNDADFPDMGFGSRRPAPGSVSPEETENLSALQLLDSVRMRLEMEGVDTRDHGILRERVVELEEIQDEARSVIEKLSAAVEKLRAPALRLGTLIDVGDDGTALVVVGGNEFLCSLGSDVALEMLETGIRVTLNEAYAVTGTMGVDTGGPVMKVRERIGPDRLRLGTDNSLTDVLVLLSPLLRKEKLKPGQEVRLDSNQRVAIEIVGSAEQHDRTLTCVEPTPWSAIGGQEEPVKAIRDAVEMPYLYADLFSEFHQSISKGFLLYGPPGCGKTLLGRATAWNLRQQIAEKDGCDRPEFFLHVKGPEILNMWLGESERQVRDLFRQCREKAAAGRLAFLFIDEAESILGTRNSGRVGTSILNTLVPMFCTEMDGLEPLQNVVVILASNRADLIDPAILRPGRIDRKIRVSRPNADGVREIYQIYLDGGFPIDGSVEDLAAGITEEHFARDESHRFLEISFRSGKRDYLYWGDLASGALVESVVSRAKELAIYRSIEEGEGASAVRLEDLQAALAKEYEENELFPPSDLTEDWLKLTDFDPANVVRLVPCRNREEVRKQTVI